MELHQLRYFVAIVDAENFTRAAEVCFVSQPSLSQQIATFLERVTLSARSDGVDVDRDRVNLLTLHSTKGLEFSRVYIVGAEDAQLPGRSPSGVEPSPAEIEEARRLLYVGMTRAKDRLVLSRAAVRGGNPTGGHRFLDEMGLVPVGVAPSSKAGLPA